MYLNLEVYGLGSLVFELELFLDNDNIRTELQMQQMGILKRVREIIIFIYSAWNAFFFQYERSIENIAYIVGNKRYICNPISEGNTCSGIMPILNQNASKKER